MTERALAQLSTACRRVFQRCHCTLLLSLPFSTPACRKVFKPYRYPSPLWLAIGIFQSYRCPSPFRVRPWPSSAATACFFCCRLLPLCHAIKAFKRCHRMLLLLPPFSTPARHHCLQSSGPAAPFLNSGIRQGLPSLPLHASSIAAAARFFRRCPSPLRHAIGVFERYISFCCRVVLHRFELAV